MMIICPVWHHCDYYFPNTRWTASSLPSDVILSLCVMMIMMKADGWVKYWVCDWMKYAKWKSIGWFIHPFFPPIHLKQTTLVYLMIGPPVLQFLSLQKSQSLSKREFLPFSSVECFWLGGSSVKSPAVLRNCPTCPTAATKLPLHSRRCCQLSKFLVGLSWFLRWLFEYSIYFVVWFRRLSLMNIEIEVSIVL